MLVFFKCITMLAVFAVLAVLAAATVGCCAGEGWWWSCNAVALPRRFMIGGG